MLREVPLGWSPLESGSPSLLFLRGIYRDERNGGYGAKMLGEVPLGWSPPENGSPFLLYLIDIWRE
ncbi:hypothetical protein TIFTF001_022553 [Ficus carica]|uniref:Uncharacterized protein n=1 Tax=Ficus carica TaxID=3494 RepID=A0AA88DK06_FICCA|nr:hypothetical protein TIFTF001_022553 [Ficus carica]